MMMLALRRLIPTTALIATSLLTWVAPVAAQDEEPNLEFFYPVVTRRPVIERELELKTRSAKSPDGSAEHEFVGAIEYPFFPWWQVELEIPVVLSKPNEDPPQTGFGDVTIENKFRLWKSLQYRALVAAGFELTLPSGSESRGLGGTFAIEPFITAAVALGPFDLIGEFHYEWQLNSNVEGERDQEVAGNLALAYRFHRLFTPFVELNTLALVRGSDLNLRGSTQVYLTPGFNVRPMGGMTVRAGVQLPVTGTRESNWVVHTGLVWEF